MPGFPRAAAMFRPFRSLPPPSRPGDDEPCAHPILGGRSESAPGCGHLLGAIGFLELSPRRCSPPGERPQPVRRGVTALGFSLTPLCASSHSRWPISFVARRSPRSGAYFGVFVSVLFYHEALQDIGGIP